VALALVIRIVVVAMVGQFLSRIAAFAGYAIRPIPGAPPLLTSGTSIATATTPTANAALRTL
jgi:hypothetical protein